MKQKLSAGIGTYIVIAERKRFLAAWTRQTKQEPQLTQGDENAWRKVLDDNYSDRIATITLACL